MVRIGVIGAVLLGLGLGPARADLLVAVDKAAQRMTVTVDGQERYTWPVSTGAAGYATPSGSFAPSRLAREHYSREWDDAPMPFSVFFTDAGHAIHGSRAVGRLGSPASHGCIRLSPGHARILFGLVQAQGLGRTRIEVSGTEAIASGGDASPAAPLDYRRLTSFNPLVSGIIAGEPGAKPRAP
ncbi:ErfK/YbiS/YcfS/YnhG family protein [Methylobacterium sp. 4-46]|uniref:L,D-transpeptidase n=1 Tax=unclassified Methylobacterium TaxID=2615210 RepID=UPI000152E6FD|nr:MULTISPECIES: L,D-transpeptidase [Methylobacterium]ACA16326.1 ErfK/YbiS/YcfS/YnhG family protein [Methylobacterium sp. 4-46]WFT82034.1 L,D-transpeptidase [Methylobacterium nodulans]